MLSDLGRGPIDFQVFHVETALTEMAIDLPVGTRGVIVKSRQTGNNRHIRISSIKGEVSKAASDNTARYFSTDGNANVASVFSLTGFRVMSADAHDAEGNPKPAQAAGTMLEQRLYLTSEQASTTIEVILIPGF